MSIRTRNIPDSIPLFVIVISKKNADGTGYSGKYRGMNWENGVSMEVFPYKQAIERRAFIGGRVELFKNITLEEIRDFAKKYGTVSKIQGRVETEYKKQVEHMIEEDFDYLEVTKGKRDAKSVKKAYQQFLNIEV